VVYKIDTGKISRARNSLNRSGVKRGTHCAGLCHVGNRAASVWTDGVCFVEEMDRWRESHCAHIRRRTCWQTPAVWQLALFRPTLEAATSTPPACAGDAPGSGGSSGSDNTGKFLFELRERFLEKQAESISSLRAWEKQDGCFILLAFGREPQEIPVEDSHESDVSTARGIEEQMCQMLDSSAAAAKKLSRCNLPLTGLAARPVATSGGARDSWLLACSSAAGLVHVALVSGK